MINREQYMEQIVPFIDKPFVKVITGIRRSGKSVVLRLIRDELLRRGVREERIIYLNFESFQWIDLKEAKALYAYIRGCRKDQSGNLVYHLVLFCRHNGNWRTNSQPDQFQDKGVSRTSGSSHRSNEFPRAWQTTSREVLRFVFPHEIGRASCRERV